MTDTTRAIAQPTSGGVKLLPILVAVLFVFVAWKITTPTWIATEQGPGAAKEVLQQELDERAAGRPLLDQLVWLLFGCLGLLVHALNRERAIQVWTKAWPLLVLIGLITLSIVWSDVPDVAFRRVVKHLLLIAAVAGIVIGVRSPAELLRLAIVFTGVLMLANIASVFMLPGVAIDHQGAIKGLHGNKNTAGAIVMVTIFLWIWAGRSSRTMWARTFFYTGTLVWFVFLIETYSRTSLITTIIAIPASISLRYLVRYPRLAVITGLLSAFVFLCAVFVLAAMGVAFSDLVAFLEGEKTTLSGRMVVWQIALGAFKENPVLGTGYGSLWSLGASTTAQYTDLPLTSFLMGLTQAHSGYIDTLATLGIVGAGTSLIFFFAFFYATVSALNSNSAKYHDLAFAEFCGFILIATPIYNIAQSAILQRNIVWVFVVLCFLLLCSLSPPANEKSAPTIKP